MHGSIKNILTSLIYLYLSEFCAMYYCLWNLIVTVTMNRTYNHSNFQFQVSFQLSWNFSHDEDQVLHNSIPDLNTNFYETALWRKIMALELNCAPTPTSNSFVSQNINLGKNDRKHECKNE